MNGPYRKIPRASPWVFGPETDSSRARLGAGCFSHRQEREKDMQRQSLVFAKLAALGVLAACFSAPSASLQGAGPAAYSGKFTLPTTVQWGTAVLPAGDYSFTLNSATLGGIAIVQGEGKAVMVISNAVSDRSTSEHSSLLIVRSGGSARVRSMHLAELGRDFYYRAPKGENQLLAQGPELIQRVLIAAAGK